MDPNLASPPIGEGSYGQWIVFIFVVIIAVCFATMLSKELEKFV